MTPLGCIWELRRHWRKFANINKVKNLCRKCLSAASNGLTRVDELLWSNNYREPILKDSHWHHWLVSTVGRWKKIHFCGHELLQQMVEVYTIRKASETACDLAFGRKPNEEITGKIIPTFGNECVTSMSRCVAIIQLPATWWNNLMSFGEQEGLYILQRKLGFPPNYSKFGTGCIE